MVRSVESKPIEAELPTKLYSTVLSDAEKPTEAEPVAEDAAPEETKTEE